MSRGIAEQATPTSAAHAATAEQRFEHAAAILTSTDCTPWQAFQTPWQKHKPTLVAENGLVFHGLRKSAVVTLLEAGCTDAEVAGQSRQMVEHYARQVNQAKLGAAAVLKWEPSGT